MPERVMKFYKSEGERERERGDRCTRYDGTNVNETQG